MPDTEAKNKPVAKTKVVQSSFDKSGGDKTDPGMAAGAMWKKLQASDPEQARSIFDFAQRIAMTPQANFDIKKFKNLLDIGAANVGQPDWVDKMVESTGSDAAPHLYLPADEREAYMAGKYGNDPMAALRNYAETGSAAAPKEQHLMADKPMEKPEMPIPRVDEKRIEIHPDVDTGLPRGTLNPAVPAADPVPEPDPAPASKMAARVADGESPNPNASTVYRKTTAADFAARPELGYPAGYEPTPEKPVDPLRTAMDEAKKKKERKK